MLPEGRSPTPASVVEIREPHECYARILENGLTSSPLVGFNMDLRAIQMQNPRFRKLFEEREREKQQEQVTEQQRVAVAERERAEEQMRLEQEEQISTVFGELFELLPTFKNAEREEALLMLSTLLSYIPVLVTIQKNLVPTKRELFQNRLEQFSTGLFKILTQSVHLNSYVFQQAIQSIYQDLTSLGVQDVPEITVDTPLHPAAEEMLFDGKDAEAIINRLIGEGYDREDAELLLACSL